MQGGNALLLKQGTNKGSKFIAQEACVGNLFSFYKAPPLPLPPPFPPPPYSAFECEFYVCAYMRVWRPEVGIFLNIPLRHGLFLLNLELTDSARLARQ